MYNRQLDTFMTVAELGSFSKAAVALYVTPSAVIQQVNDLEDSLQAKLLVRTHRGTALTPAGELLYREGKVLVEQSRSIRKKLKALQEEPRRELRVGTMLLHQCRLFYPLWKRFSGASQGYRVQMVELQRGREEQELPDLIEGVDYGRRGAREMELLELVRVPIACTVWKDHPLAAKKLLRYEDMAEQTMVTISGPQYAENLELLEEDARAHGMTVIPVDRYDLSVFSMCAANGYLLQIPLCWRDIHPEMTAIPCEWDLSLPYGFYHHKDAAEPARRFIAFVRELLEQPGTASSLRRALLGDADPVEGGTAL